MCCAPEAQHVHRPKPSLCTSLTSRNCDFPAASTLLSTLLGLLRLFLCYDSRLFFPCHASIKVSVSRRWIFRQSGPLPYDRADARGAAHNCYLVHCPTITCCSMPSPSQMCSKPRAAGTRRKRGVQWNEIKPSVDGQRGAGAQCRGRGTSWGCVDVSLKNCISFLLFSSCARLRTGESVLNILPLQCSPFPRPAKPCLALWERHKTSSFLQCG